MLVTRDKIAVLDFISRMSFSQKENISEILSKQADDLFHLFNSLNFQNPITFTKALSILSALNASYPLIFDPISCYITKNFVTFDPMWSAAIDIIIQFLPFFVSNPATAKNGRKILDYFYSLVDKNVISKSKLQLLEIIRHS